MQTVTTPAQAGHQLVEDSTSRYYSKVLSLEERAQRNETFTEEEIRSLQSFHLLAHQLVHCIRLRRQRHLEVLLSHLKPAELNRNHSHGMNLSHGKTDEANLLVCTLVQPINTPEELIFKLGLAHRLLDLGFTSVNGCFYSMGVSGPTAFAAACNPGFFPGITEDEHHRLVARIYQAGGQPLFQVHPLAKSARHIVEAHAPYLSDLVPGNEAPDGQRTFWNHDDLPEHTSPAFQRSLHSSTLALLSCP